MEKLTEIQNRILKVLSWGRRLTNTDLAKIMKEPKTTVGDNLRKLLKLNNVRKESVIYGQGRPKQLWSVIFSEMIRGKLDDRL